VALKLVVTKLVCDKLVINSWRSARCTCGEKVFFIIIITLVGSTYKNYIHTQHKSEEATGIRRGRVYSVTRSLKMAQQFLQRIHVLVGYHCEKHNNPPDFFLDVINGHSSTLSDIPIGVFAAVFFLQFILHTNSYFT